MFDKLLLVLILVGNCHHLLASKNKTCEDLLRELGDGQSKFVFCATAKSVPVKLCVGCEKQYHNMTDHYDLLMATSNCSKIYLDTDRINIVSTTQGALTSLWEKANCADCFKGNNSQSYEKFWNKFDICLTQHKGTECAKCQEEYISLNDFYLEMDKESQGQVCFDLQDSMNRTRSKWSKELKCCQREVKLNLFLVTAVLVVVVPLVLFYSTSFVLIKRREAAHGVLNQQTPELDAPAASTSALITAAILSTATQPAEAEVSARTEKIAKVLRNAADSQLETDSSSDEEPLIKPKTN